MSRWAYLGVLLVVLASVGFGLDWQPATLSPMRDVKIAAPLAPVAASNPNPVIPVSPVPAPPPEQTVGTGPPRRSTQMAGETAPLAPNCNVQACAAAYRSFVAADCSYQPLNGPRRRCEKK